MPRLQSDDVALYYESIGHGIPLLFIHGLGASTRDWQQQVKHFSSRYQVLTIDLRGHGQSTKHQGPYTIAQFARDIVALIKRLDISSAHVVGHSLGGMVAFELAVTEPELIRSLVIVNSGPEIPMNTLSLRLRVYLIMYLRHAIVQIMGIRYLGRYLGKKLFPRPDQKNLRESFIERWAENDKWAYLHSLDAVLGWSVSSVLGTISCPTLIIASEYDYTPLAFKKAYVDRITSADLVVIPDSRHFVPLDQPERFNHALMSFLNKRQ